MCGRYTLTYSDLGAVVAELDALLDPAAAELYRPRYNIAPTQTTLVARPGPARAALVPAVWGLRRDRRLVINARSESAPARFPAAYQRGRCVVPADGFYEWTGTEGARRPLWFHTRSGAPLLMAGLFEETAGALPAFVVLTTAARPPVAAIHDRMPVLLSPEGARRWILGQPPRAIVPDDVPLVGLPVSPRANAVAHDDPACLAPPPPEPPEPPEGTSGKQLGLFR